MKFTSLSIDQAEGAILAHSVRLATGTFKKGHVLSTDDIAVLSDAGLREVTVARLDADDVGEDDAARAVARAACGDGIKLGPAFTGRCNLYSEHAGVVVMNRDRLDRINLVDEAVTIATLPPFEPAEPRQMVATVKIIPFAVPRGMLETCTRIAEEGGPLIRVAPFGERAVGLVLTHLPGMKERILDSTTEAVKARLAMLGSALVGEIRCDHKVDAVAAAVRGLADQGAQMILIYGASAITDRRDVIPAGIELAGGELEHLGMPVDPGNLLLLARYGRAPVIGLPGCARSPKLNGFDWVLQRLAAGLEVTGRDIMLMGAGGLLKEIPLRPLPRAKASPPEPAEAAAAPRTPRVAALVLAAGQSRRMGKVNKLLAEVDGIAMVTRVVDAVLASKAHPVVVVTGFEAEAVSAALKGRKVHFVHNPDYAEGLSTSLTRGITALPNDVDGALVCLGDMPRVKKKLINKLITAFNPAEGRGICVPTYRGKRGNPVLWARRFFPEMREVAGDVGARHLIGAHDEVVREVASDDDGVLVDVDTPDALTGLKRAAKATS
ncbi:MAG: NTP transferase domain-containing protein [Alphaproteobacteria bacterium]